MDDDYPLLSLFVTIFWFFLFVAWIWLLIALVTDIFRSRDLPGWGKALWTLFIVVLPIVGALVYLIARGAGMTGRMADEFERREHEFESRVRGIAAGAGTSPADELTKLARLRDAGDITASEFESQKAKLLA
ncbi:phospholipase D-like protein [Haloactinopolyspora alba]|uniref:Phospholipase D-like protein n=1 Tax=Haloactinopolyspora alba TaxID=648780 RepID=A0A2P8E021_9ACTN|nr:SHOCT domain-containing protein [Haloactinopolyspora alba]PSL02814.1 phospholipase D-like protein [Haloactinopolyspora alba]